MDRPGSWIWQVSMRRKGAATVRRFESKSLVIAGYLGGFFAARVAKTDTTARGAGHLWMSLPSRVCEVLLWGAWIRLTPHAAEEG